jgi:hypothetical protein
MSLDPKLPITLNLTLNEVDGVIAGLGELPTKTGAFSLLMKIQAQLQSQLPAQEEVKIEEQ